MKGQVVVNKKTKKVMCTDFCPGKTHDFRLFKESKVHFKAATNAKTDSGYQGMQDIHPNSTIPLKRKPKQKGIARVPLTKEQRQYNHQLASDRILNEHVNGALKRFRIIADKYRNRRKRFGLRFNLIASIYNLQVGL
jgi:DDE superfamily endonuclease